MKNDDHLYLDHVQMRARGWTRTHIERFLVRTNRREAVNPTAMFFDDDNSNRRNI